MYPAPANATQMLTFPFVIMETTTGYGNNLHYYYNATGVANKQFTAEVVSSDPNARFSIRANPTDSSTNNSCQYYKWYADAIDGRMSLTIRLKSATYFRFSVAPATGSGSFSFTLNVTLCTFFLLIISWS